MIAFKIAVVFAILFVIARFVAFFSNANRKDVNRVFGLYTGNWDTATVTAKAIEIICGYGCVLSLLIGIAIHLFQS